MRLSAAASLAVMGLAIAARPVFAEPHDSSSTPVGDFAVAAPSQGAQYAKIYQAPLFVSMFALAAKETPVDETALRYYASQRNTARVEAEIRRLKALHPGWTPPTNPYAPAGAGNDEQPFWDLFAADRLNELHAGLALREKREPGWRPSRELADKLRRKEATNAMVAAENAGDWAQALRIADDAPDILNCGSIDADWRVAEAFINLGKRSRAFEIYQAILSTCTTHDERLATVRKAIPRFPADDVKRLFDMGAKMQDGTGEFDSARVDLTRARIAEINAGQSSHTIEADDLAAFFAAAKKSGERVDFALAGWYEFKLGQWADADVWFALGTPPKPSADDLDGKFVLGHGLSLLKLGKPDDARRLAWSWRANAQALTDLYVSATLAELADEGDATVLTEADLADFAGVVRESKSFEGASALGWRNLKFRAYDSGAEWFKMAIGYRGIDVLANPDGANSDAAKTDSAGLKAIEGEVLALAAGGRLAEAADVAEIWRGASPALADSFISVVTTMLNASEPTQGLTPHRIHAYADISMARRSVSAAKSLGWYNYRAKDWSAAVDWFRSAVDWSQDRRGDDKTNEGLALALKNAGRWSEAEDVAWRWRERSRSLRSVYFAVMVAQLTAPEAQAVRASLSRGRVERFAKLVRVDRSSEGAKALGWFALSDATCAFAAPWFRDALAWSADGADDSKSEEGLAEALRAVGRYGEAEDVAYAQRDHAPEMRDLYKAIAIQELTQELPPVAIPEARMARFAQFVLAERSPDGAQALGWRRYRQPAEGYGAQWFALATTWTADKPRDAKMDEGYVLALRAISKLSEAEALASPDADKSEPMKKLYVDVMVEELSRDNPPEPVDEGRLASFVRTIEPMKSPLGAQALGWYRLERGETREAAIWFERAVDWWPKLKDGQTSRLSAPDADYEPILAKLALLHPDYRKTPRAYSNSTLSIGKPQELYVETLEGREKTWEGYALTLRALGRVDEAEKIAFEHRAVSPALRKLSIEIAIAALSREGGSPLPEERLRRYRNAIVEDRSAPGAEALGWRAYRGPDYAAAAQWFQTSLDWLAREKDAKPRVEVVEALVLSLRALSRLDDALAIATRFRAMGGGFGRIYFEATFAALEKLPAEDPAVAARRAAVEKEIADARSIDGATAYGWFLYRAHDYSASVRSFRDAVAWRTPETKTGAPLEGLALALCAQTSDDEYCSFAYSWRTATEDTKALYADAMVAWLAKTDAPSDMPASALANFQAFVTEEKSVMGARALGWRFSRAKDWPTSLAWFKQALKWGEVDLKTPSGAADDAKTVEGYAQALRNSGEVVQAQDIAYLWRDRSPELRALYFQSAVQSFAASTPPMDDPRVVRFADEAAADRSLDGAQNLGWLAYRGKDFAAAVTWFGRGVAWAPEGEADIKTYEGYALSLLSAERFADAEAVAWKWRGKSKDLRAVFVNAMVAELSKPELAATLDDERIGRLMRLSLADHSFAGAEAIGWWRQSDEHCADALPWFRRAVEWSTDGKGDAKTNEGLALALDRLGRSAEAEDIAFAWSTSAPDMRALYLKIGAVELTREWPRVSMDAAHVERYRKIVMADRSSVGMQALAWNRYMKSGEAYAGQWFQLAQAWAKDGKGDAKLNEGYALAMRAIGRNAQAEEIVFPWVADVPAMKKLYIDTGVEELSRDNPPEPMDEPRVARYLGVIEPVHSALGAQAVGWYRYERGENDAAITWFKNALDWWPKPKPKDDSDKKPLVPVDDYNAILAKLALLHPDYRRTPRAYPNSSLLIGQDAKSYVDTPEGLAKTVQGYAMALRAAGRSLEAEDLAYAWRDRWPPLRALFLQIAADELAKDDAPLAADRLARYVLVISEEKSSLGAAAMAWRATRANQYDDASKWFASALDWRDAKAAPDLDLVHGAAMALRLGTHLDQAAALVEKWRDALPALRDESIQITFAQLAGLDPNSPDAAKKIATLAADVAAARAPDGAQAIGWLAYRRKEWPVAEAWFKKAVIWTVKGDPSPKALEGLARAVVAEGRLQEAFTFTDQWSAKVADLKPIFIDIAAAMLASPPDGAPELPDDAVARAGAVFAQARSAPGAQSLAWARLRVKDYATAVDWFKAAISWSDRDGGDPKSVEGLLIALRGLNRFDEAEALAFKGAKTDENLRQVYLEIVSDRLTRQPPIPPNAEGLSRFATMVLSASSASGAEALGWFSFNTRQVQAAASWFEKALGWAPDESAAFGAALSYKAMGDRQDYFRIVGLYRMQYGKIADLAAGRRTDRGSNEQRAALETTYGGGWTVPQDASQSAASLDAGDQSFDDPAPVRRHARRPPNGGGALGVFLKHKDYAGCIAKANALAQSGKLSGAEAVIEGWCLLGASRPAEAARVFDYAVGVSHGSTHDDAAYGKSLALLQMGRSGDAVNAAGSGDLTAERRNDVGLQALSQQANDAYQSGRYAAAIALLDRRKAYAPETRDLVQLRAWSLFKLGDKAHSVQLFRALDDQMSTLDTQTGLSAAEANP